MIDTSKTLKYPYYCNSVIVLTWKHYMPAYIQTHLLFPWSHAWTGHRKWWCLHPFPVCDEAMLLACLNTLQFPLCRCFPQLSPILVHESKSTTTLIVFSSTSDAWSHTLKVIQTHNQPWGRDSWQFHFFSKDLPAKWALKNPRCWDSSLQTPLSLHPWMEIHWTM